MATITASLERSLQNCSLNHPTSGARTRRGRTSSDSSLHQNYNHTSPTTYSSSCLHNHSFNPDNNTPIYQQKQESVTQSNASSSDDNSTFVDLNSHVSLPYHWEQCLDLKTGEIYYINWSNGMKAKEDPRTTATGYNGDYYSEDDEHEEEEDDDDDDEDEDENEEEEEGEIYSYDSEGSSTESNSAPSSSSNMRSLKRFGRRNRYHSNNNQQVQQQQQELSQDSVLVVAGCKCCLMYHMVPRHVLDCPKCSGQLLHFPTNNNHNNNNSNSNSSSP